MLTTTTLKQYIESKKSTVPGKKNIADHVLDDGVITENDLLFMNAIYEKYVNDQPFKGKTVLFNQHIDWATFLLILVYQALGAKVEVSNFNLTEKSFAQEALAQSNIPYFRNQLPNHTSDYYRHIVNCGGLTINNFVPKDGMAELTQTYPHIYQGKSIPIVSVNETYVKMSEDYTGIGVAGIAALRPAVQNLLALQAGKDGISDQNKDYIYNGRLKDNYYVIIGGAGKVAAGTARALILRGVEPTHILLVDRDKRNALAPLMDDTKDIHFLESDDGQLLGIDKKDAFKAAILKHMQKTQPESNFTHENFCKKLALITATGVQNLMSNYGYSPSDFDPKETWFINMGQPDEYGDNFDEDVMMGNTKGALNFNSKWLKRENGKHPATPTQYLMPSFAALVESSVHAIKKQAKQPGLQSIPVDTDKSLLELAVKIYGDEFKPILHLLQSRQQNRLQNDGVAPASMSDTSSNSQKLSPKKVPPPSPERNESSVGKPFRIYTGSKRKIDTSTNADPFKFRKTN